MSISHATVPYPNHYICTTCIHRVPRRCEYTRCSSFHDLCHSPASRTSSDTLKDYSYHCTQTKQHKLCHSQIYLRILDRPWSDFRPAQRLWCSFRPLCHQFVLCSRLTTHGARHTLGRASLPVRTTSMHPQRPIPLLSPNSATGIPLNTRDLCFIPQRMEEATKFLMSGRWEERFWGIAFRMRYACQSRGSVIMRRWAIFGRKWSKPDRTRELGRARAKNIYLTGSRRHIGPKRKRILVRNGWHGIGIGSKDGGVDLVKDLIRFDTHTCWS